MTMLSGLDQHRFDFTEERYRALLRRAKANYRFITYDALELDARVVLWRHDLDYSVHRGLALARIEAEEQVIATYFVHLHNEFYHWGEKAVAKRLREIVALGHRLALHFDPGYYEGRMRDGDELAAFLGRERSMLEGEFGPIRAFSFHNPDVGGNWLQYDADSIAGMVNAYGSVVTKNFSYCSDSNGYWRFRRLVDVLEAAKEPRLQVLTHPGWWQKEAMHPRERLYRAAHGRMRATMGGYDDVIARIGRKNLAGPSGALDLIRDAVPEEIETLDDLWSRHRFDVLFLELLRLQEGMSKSLPPHDAEMENWHEIRERVMRGEKAGLAAEGLEAECVSLCRVIQNISKGPGEEALQASGLP